MAEDQTKTTPTGQNESEDENDQTVKDSEVGEKAGESQEKQAEAGKKQSREENAKYAQMRRESEAKAKAEKDAKDREISQAYLKGQLDSIKENPYTKEPIQDEYDLEMFKAMKELDEQGKDPTKDLPKYLASLTREKATKAKEESDKKAKDEEEAKKKISDDLKELKDAYPDLDTAKLSKDSDFVKFAENKFGRWTYKEIYEAYQASKAPKADNSQKPKQGSPSSVPSGSKPAKSFKDMTEDEYVEYCKAHYGGW